MRASRRHKTSRLLKARLLFLDQYNRTSNSSHLCSAPNRSLTHSLAASFADMATHQYPATESTGVVAQPAVAAHDGLATTAAPIAAHEDTHHVSRAMDPKEAKSLTKVRVRIPRRVQRAESSVSGARER